MHAKLYIIIYKLRAQAHAWVVQKNMVCGRILKNGRLFSQKYGMV